LAWADGPRLIVAAALEEIALETIREREPLPAVPLLSAATSLRQTMGAPIRPADQPRIEAGLATARAALPSRTFASAWTRGQTSALDDVIAPVLGSAFSLSRGQGAGERPPRSQPVEVT
jgi:hypothetical protein